MERELERLKRTIEDALKNYAARVENAELREAMEYGLFSGGKCVRPLLTLVCAFAEGGGRGVTRAVPFACAVEMIHAYSLIHDDLPAMGDDDFRRGQTDAHKKFGEGMAILAGDALFALAFEVMAETRRSTHDMWCRVFAMEAIARAAGANGMVGGLVGGVKADYKTADGAIIEGIYAQKTAALIQAASVVGGLVGRGFWAAARRNKERLIKLSDASAALGMAFRYKDDVLDGEGVAQNIEGVAQNIEGAVKDAAAAKFGEYSGKALEGFSSLYGTKSLPYYLAKIIMDRTA